MNGTLTRRNFLEIGQPDKMPMEKAIGLAVKNGATAICIQGMRIKPADTLPYVFKRLKRKDGICVGVFPKHNRDEVKENVTLTQELTGIVG